MGLDMNLYKKTYVKNWEYYGKKDRTEVKVTGAKAEAIKPERIAYIIEEVAYWRKANSIHKWFVDNCNEGDDNNGNFPVYHSKLEELKEICKKVLASCELVEGKITNGYTINKNKQGKMVKIPILADGRYIKDSKVANELLPTASGFFFGSTDYDEYYYRDVFFTYNMLSDLLSEKGADMADYEYSASW